MITVEPVARVRGIGAPMPSLEAREWVRGQGQYLADIRLPGMLEMALVRSPHAHAAISGVEVGAARAAWAVTGRELLSLTRPLRFRHRKPLRPLAWYALAVDAAVYAGQPVAAVVAANRYQAEDAAEAVKVRYRPLPAVVDPRDALAANAPRVYDEWPDNVLYEETVEFGDVDAVFAKAPQVIERWFRIPRVAPQPMETRGVLARFDGRRLEIWSMSQWPYVLRTIVAESLGWPENRIVVMSPDVGGSFGLKMHIYPEDILVPLAALQLGRPVRWLEDRREHFLASVHGRGQHNRARLAANGQGRILAVDLDLVADVGAGCLLQPGLGPATNTALTMPGPYRLAAYRARVRWVVTNKTPTGAYRGYGVPEAAFMMERLVDELAGRLREDPAALRRRNLLTPQELPTVSAAGLELDASDYPAILDSLLERADYGALRAWQQKERARGRALGVGVAFYLKGSVSDPRSSMGAWGSYESCTVRVDLDGSVSVVAALADQGQSHRTMLAQVVGDTLGLDPTAVAVTLIGSGPGAYGLGAWGSRGAAMGGSAALKASLRLRERLIGIAAVMAGSPPAFLRWEEGAVVAAGGRRFDLRAIADFCYNQSFLLPEALKPPLEASATIDASVMQTPREGRGRVNKWLTYTAGAHLAVVAVDPATGQVRCLRHYAVHDVGRAINPRVIAGQEQGGIAQGMGSVLLEEVVYDPQGQLQTGSFMDYVMPSALEMPAMESWELEYPSARVEGGFKGAGEGSVVGAVAAVANAVADALAEAGRQVTQLPATPMRVWSWLRQSATE